MAEKIKFINDDPDAVVASLVTYFEGLTGRVLQPAQVEQLIFNAGGYRIGLMLSAMNETANKCLVEFADGQALELLGEPLGVKRLPAAFASCLLRFSLVAGHGFITIPAGIRVQSIDGQAVFITTETKNVDAGVVSVDIKAECTKKGVVGNGYGIGLISVILDPQPYVASVANLDITANGSDVESDDRLRQRILLAPASFSVAGPKEAYKFFALSAHPNIVDVAVDTGHEVDFPFDIIPGQVDIFPLMNDGSAPDTEIIDAINAICNDEKRRPLTDTVVIKAPNKTDFSIEVELILLTDAVLQDVVDKVTANLEAYRDARKNKLGIDVVLTQLIGACQVEGVYRVAIVSPLFDIVAGVSDYNNCTGITVTVTGTHDA
jgi:phage-related baseplate assembly protein